jgi:Putative adhesin
MQKTFDVPGPVELEIRLAAGDVAIDASLGGQVEVELEARDDDSRRLIEEAQVELHDGRLVVEVPQRRGLGFVMGRGGIECRIRCPEGSGVSARTKSADVAVRGAIGGLNVQTASGDVAAARVTGGLNVKSASGDVQVDEVGAGANVQTASGDVAIGVARGAANITTASGEVTIREAYENLNANTVSGDQEHRAVMSGRVAAHSVSGDVQIGVRRGSRVYLECNTVSGETSSELELQSEAPAGDGPLVEIRAKTVSGDIRILRAPAPATETQEVQG